MADIYIRNQRKHLLSIIPLNLKFSRFLIRNNLRKMLTLNMYETASRRPLSATDSLQR